MIILVINSGSSSLKYQLFNMKNQEVLLKGKIDEIGSKNSFVEHTKQGQEIEKIKKNITNHQEGLEYLFELLVDKQHGVLDSLDQISAIGHRVVHGGEYFSDSVIVDDEVIEKIKKCSEIAPLHNPANIEGIIACKKLFPHIPQIAVFDTSFHQTMEAKSYLYAIPHKYYEKYGIRKYGFHGTSHKFISNKVDELMNDKGGMINHRNSAGHSDKLKLISCHIGNGASVCAIQGEKVVDTSMGMTPLEGLIMGTRSGDIDPAIIPFLMEKEGFTAHDVKYILNKESGILGLSGESRDMRKLLEKKNKGDDKSKDIFDMYISRIVKYIGAYVAMMNGVDIIVLTAGVMENGPAYREALFPYLGYLGIELDLDANKAIRTMIKISKGDTFPQVRVIPTNEELMIAKETFNALD